MVLNAHLFAISPALYQNLNKISGGSEHGSFTHHVQVFVGVT